MIDIYVDGSWMAGRVGYGAAILKDGQLVHELFGPIADADTGGTRQVAGELFAVGHALRWCQAKGISQVAIYYDYAGIEAWAEGRWKAKKPITQRYAKFIRGLKGTMAIRWHKVAAHSGNEWNDYVDELAKRGAQGEKSTS